MGLPPSQVVRACPLTPRTQGEAGGPAPILLALVDLSRGADEDFVELTRSALLAALEALPPYALFGLITFGTQVGWDPAPSEACCLARGHMEHALASEVVGAEASMHVLGSLRSFCLQPCTGVTPSQTVNVVCACMRAQVGLYDVKAGDSPTVRYVPIPELQEGPGAHSLSVSVPLEEVRPRGWPGVVCVWALVLLLSPPACPACWPSAGGAAACGHQPCITSASPRAPRGA